MVNEGVPVFEQGSSIRSRNWRTLLKVSRLPRRREEALSGRVIQSPPSQSDELCFAPGLLPTTNRVEILSLCVR